MMFWDSTYLLIIVGMLLSFAASSYVKSTFNKYSAYSNQRGYTGREVAGLILKAADIPGVEVQQIAGDLTDNYNSQTKILSLSESVAEATSVSAIGVAAHECGHAVQDQVSYLPLKLRGALVPVANFGSTISLPLIMLGLFLGQFGQILINVGIVCFSAALLFQLITLPVEFNASRRALGILEQEAILSVDELAMARKVLVAAALTYVASAISVFLQLLRLVMLFGNRRD